MNFPSAIINFSSAEPEARWRKWRRNKSWGMNPDDVDYVPSMRVTGMVAEKSSVDNTVVSTGLVK